MCARKRNSKSESNPAGCPSAGWRELHLALQGGVPHGTEIVMLLDSCGFTFPTPPAFDSQRTELRCYRVIHRAWREDLLPDFLRLLRIWRTAGGPLCQAARRAEFQTALFEFMLERRRVGLPALVACLGRQPPWGTAPAGDVVSVDEARRRFNALWTECRGRRAA